MDILLATRNEHKIREICDIFLHEFTDRKNNRSPGDDHSLSGKGGNGHTLPFHVRDKSGTIGGKSLFPVTFFTLRDFPGIPETEEDGDTFEENAVKKAAEAVDGALIVTLADDSGLEVDCLDGRPGVLSARFSGIHGDYAANNRKLLALLEKVPDSERGARFTCVVAIAVPGERVRTVRGECEGIIAQREAGKGGFGYDPVFYLPELEKTMAELTPDEKNAISHRGKAFRKAFHVLRSHR
jgi:XTP/dITP diphosphohydrolase